MAQFPDLDDEILNGHCFFLWYAQRLGGNWATKAQMSVSFYFLSQDSCTSSDLPKKNGLSFPKNSDLTADLPDTLFPHRPCTSPDHEKYHTAGNGLAMTRRKLGFQNMTVGFFLPTLFSCFVFRCSRFSHCSITQHTNRFCSPWISAALRPLLGFLGGCRQRS